MVTLSFYGMAVGLQKPEPEADSGEVQPDSDNQDDDEGAPLQAAE
jgi:hypothetical protein